MLKLDFSCGSRRIWKRHTHRSKKEMLAITRRVYLPRQTSVDEVSSIWWEILAELWHCCWATSDGKDGCHARHVGPNEKKKKVEICFVTSEAGVCLRKVNWNCRCAIFKAFSLIYSGLFTSLFLSQIINCLNSLSARVTYPLTNNSTVLTNWSLTNTILVHNLLKNLLKNSLEL